MIDRREFFLNLAKFAALSATTPNLWRLQWRPRFADDPFKLGVASGDPTSSGVTLWTRLAPRPLELDGGMSDARPVVFWELAADPQFTKLVKRGKVTATPELGHSVHIDVDGLRPDWWYYYRFMTGDAVSPVGRTRTTPDGSSERPLKFAFASCQHYEQGLFTAYAHMAEEQLDLVTHLGDYIYEYGPGTATTNVRKHVGEEIRSIGDYRRRYAQYKSDAFLQAAHARCPWSVIWDDHEVHNNYSSFDTDSLAGSQESQRDRRAAAYQAWWENQPVRISPTKSWADLQIYRTMNWGRIARFWALDERQYRWDQACGDGNKVIPCGDYADPKRVMLGEAQTKWLEKGLSSSQTRWQVLSNQVTLSPPDVRAKEGERVDMDKWSGYPTEQDRVLAAVAKHAPARTIVLTGDIHNSWVYDVRRGFDTADRPVIATEFIGTSISSGGDGADNIARLTPEYLAARPSLKWANNRRGYVVCSVTSNEWRAEYRTLPYVRSAGAPLDTPAKWRVERGRAGVERV